MGPGEGIGLMHSETQPFFLTCGGMRAKLLMLNLGMPTLAPQSIKKFPSSPRTGGTESVPIVLGQPLTVHA